jgi:hypothetical protein
MGPAWEAPVSYRWVERDILAVETEVPCELSWELHPLCFQNRIVQHSFDIRMLIPRIEVRSSSSAASRTCSEPAEEQTWHKVRPMNATHPA